MRWIGPALLLAAAAATHGQTTLTEAQFLDRLRGGWAGQMVGVTWGAATEFRYLGRTIPAGEVPTWYPGLINDAFDQDDLYIELPFLDAMARHGVTASWTDYGNAFRDAAFVPNWSVWEANEQAWSALRRGVSAPWSGHYSQNAKSWAIDWQIESNYIGTITPGMRSAAIDLSWRTGHVMNYGDGVYGGVAMAAMQSAAFVATSLDLVIQAGRQAAPVGSNYRAIVEDVFTAHASGQTWQQTWQMLQNKWANQHPLTFPHSGETYDVTANLNGAYVFMGLLYGQGDFTESMRLAMMCGQDSDCNPSTVAAILGTYYGFSAIDPRYTSALDTAGRTFVGYGGGYDSGYTFDDCIAVSRDLAADVLALNGGSITGAGPDAVWTLPDRPAPAPLLETLPTGTGNAAPQLNAQVTVGDQQQVTFTSSATDADGVLAYQWYFGDTTYRDGASGTHTYARPGSYTAICYVTDNTGHTSWQSFLIDVAPAFHVPSTTIDFSDLASGEYTLPATYLPTALAGVTDLDITWLGWAANSEGAFPDHTDGGLNRHLDAEVSDPSIVFSRAVIVESLALLQEAAWGEPGLSVTGLLAGDVVWSLTLDPALVGQYTQVTAGAGLFIDELRFGGARFNYLDDLVITTGVPEPATLAVLGLAGLLTRRARGGRRPRCGGRTR